MARETSPVESGDDRLASEPTNPASGPDGGRARGDPGRGLSRRRLLVTGGAVLATGAVGAVLLDRRADVETEEDRRPSLWTLEAPRLPEFARYGGDAEVDVAVVGGGYTGLACASYLRRLRPEWRVAVFESHGLGSGASSRNSAMAVAEYTGRSDQVLAGRAMARFRGFLDEEEIQCDFRPQGVLYLYPSRPAAERALSSYGGSAQLLLADELREEIVTDFYPAALALRESHAVHPGKLVVGLVRAAERAGVELYERSPVLRIRGGAPAHLVTPEGRVRARQVVVATNAHTPRLGVYRSAIFPIHHYSLATRMLTARELESYGLTGWGVRYEERLLPISTSVTASGRLVVRILLGYATFASCQWADHAGAQHLARQTLVRRFPWATDLEIEHAWHGVTGHTADFRGIVGRLGPNVHVSVAYNGTGLIPAHYNGFLTASQVVGESPRDLGVLSRGGRLPFPEPLRSLVLKPTVCLFRAS